MGEVWRSVALAGGESAGCVTGSNLAAPSSALPGSLKVGAGSFGFDVARKKHIPRFIKAARREAFARAASAFVVSLSFASASVQAFNQAELEREADAYLARAASALNVLSSRVLDVGPGVLYRGSLSTRPMPGYPNYLLISGDVPVEISEHTRGRSKTAIFCQYAQTWGITGD